MRPGFRNFRAPTISKEALDEFLSRDLRDYEFLKDAPKEDLRAELKAQGFRYATEPRHHQLVANMIGTMEPRWLFLLPPGAGKSKIIIDKIRWHKKRGKLLRALILAPEQMHVYSWEDQLQEHGPDLSYLLLMGDRDFRMHAIASKVDVMVMNYKGLEVYMTQLRDSKKKNSKGRRERVIDADLAADFALRFNFVAFDESHRLGNHDSLLYRMCLFLGAACDYVYELTGTAFRRNPTMLWSQFFLVDSGETLGRTLGMFRSVFMNAKKHYFKGVEYTFNPKRSGDLSRVIRNRALSYDDKEINKDTPPKVSIKLRFAMSEEGADYYERITKKMQEMRGDYASLKNPYIRMRQVCSGYLSLKADDESRIQVKFKENAKLDALEQWIAEREGKFLIYHEFRPSGDWIAELLTRMKIKFSRLAGGVKDIGGQYQRFLTDPKVTAFVLNNAMGSEAINPQYVCHQLIFYESPDDPIQRTQAERRIWRPGQQYPSLVYDLLPRGNTIESKILKYNLQGKSLLKAVVSGKETLEDEK